jgi:hypothetical protein
VLSSLGTAESTTGGLRLASSAPVLDSILPQPRIAHDTIVATKGTRCDLFDRSKAPNSEFPLLIRLDKHPDDAVTEGEVGASGYTPFKPTPPAHCSSPAHADGSQMPRLLITNSTRDRSARPRPNSKLAKGA